MKIIFDSEEQKEKFLDEITAFSCPYHVGIGLASGCMNEGAECRDCWKNCGIEMEVEENE